MAMAVEMDDGRTCTDGKDRMHRAEDPSAHDDDALARLAHQVTSARHSPRIQIARLTSSLETFKGGDNVSTLPTVVLRDKPRSSAA
jgi:hypothetical protein